MPCSTYAVDLPGHGLEAQYEVSYQAPQGLTALAGVPSTLAGVTLDDCVDRVARVVTRLHKHGPVILVGAGLGGVTIAVPRSRDC